MAVELVFAPVNRGADFQAFDEETGNELEVFSFDATLSESYTQQVEYTEHPTESNTIISDHAIVRPETVSFTGALSRTTLDDDPTIPNEAGRLETATQAILAIAKERRALFVVTPFRVLDGYRITNVGITRTPDIGQGAEFSVDLKYIETVDSVRVAIPPEVIAAEKRSAGTSEQSGGTQSGQETTTEDELGPDLGFKGKKSRAAAGFDFTIGRVL